MPQRFCSRRPARPGPEAIAAAERHTGGKAIEVGLERLNRRAVYEVVVLRNGAIRKLTAAPALGQVGRG